MKSKSIVSAKLKQIKEPPPITYDEVIYRMSYFMDLNNLSNRATSFTLGYNEQFIKRIMNKTVKLKVSTLLEFCEIMNITITDFFYLGNKYNENDKNLLNMFSRLSNENKEIIISLMNKLK